MGMGKGKNSGRSQSWEDFLKINQATKPGPGQFIRKEVMRKMNKDFKTGGLNFKLLKGDILIKNKKGEMVFYCKEEENYILVGIWNERRDPGKDEINLAELLAGLLPIRKAVFDVTEFMEKLSELKPTDERHEVLLTDMLTGKKAVLGLKLSRPV